MKTLGLKDFRARLCELARDMRSGGGAITVTHRGKPCLMITPYNDAEALAALEAAKAEGILIPPDAEEAVRRQAPAVVEEDAATWQCACLYTLNTGGRCFRCNRRAGSTWTEGLTDPEVNQEAGRI